MSHKRNKPDLYFSNAHHIQRTGNFIRIGIQQIFIGYTDSQWMGDTSIIYHMNTNIPARFHFFIANEYDMSDEFFITIRYITEKFNPAVKVRIHFPYTEKHLLEVFNMKWVLDDKRVRASAERKFPEFYHGGRTYQNLHGDTIKTSALRIVQDGKTMRAEFVLYEQSASYGVNGQPIQNSAERSNPDAYREDIISRFKAVTPLGILKSFKDEDDIWDFIKLENRWKAEPKNQNVSINIKDLGTNDPNEMKKILTNMMKQAANEMIKDQRNGEA